MRIRALDIAKGVGILSVCWVHFHENVVGGNSRFILTFFLTIFYLVEGWILDAKEKDVGLGPLARRRLRQLGLPYLYWSGILLGVDLLLCIAGIYPWYYIPRDIFKTLILRGIGTLWFLPAILFGELACRWLMQRSRWLLLLTLPAGYLLHWVVPGLVPDNDAAPYWALEQLLLVPGQAGEAMMYIAAGTVIAMGARRLKALEHTFISLALGFILTAGTWYVTMRTPLPEDSFLRIVCFVATSLTGSTGILLLSIGLSRSAIMNFFDYWGRNSLSMMITHYSITMVLLQWIAVGLMGYDYDRQLAGICFLVSLPLQWLIATLLNRYAPRLLGHQRQVLGQSDK